MSLPVSELGTICVVDENRLDGPGVATWEEWEARREAAAIAKSATVVAAKL